MLREIVDQYQNTSNAQECVCVDCRHVARTFCGRTTREECGRCSCVKCLRSGTDEQSTAAQTVTHRDIIKLTINHRLLTMVAQTKRLFHFNSCYSNTAYTNINVQNISLYLLTATFKDLHIENSKNYKRRYCPHHTDCVSMCC